MAASAGMSPAVLSRMIGQDIARSQGGRMLPGLRTGKVDGRPLRWFVASLPFDESGVEALTVSGPEALSAGCGVGLAPSNITAWRFLSGLR